MEIKNKDLYQDDDLVFVYHFENHNTHKPEYKSHIKNDN